jgi:hypothetical protein
MSKLRDQSPQLANNARRVMAWLRSAGASVLLRQPRGFEGVGLVLIGRRAYNLSAAYLVQAGGASGENPGPSGVFAS